MDERRDVWRAQQQLTRVLGGWAGVSVLAGGVLALTARRRGAQTWAAHGQQQAAWGATNGAIALVGEWRRRRKLARLAEPYAPDVLDRERRSLRRLLLLNAGLDCLYVAGGVGLLRRPELVRLSERRSPAALRGDGAAIVVQGVALLVLDTSFARRLR